MADGEGPALLIVGDQREVGRVGGMGHGVHDRHGQAAADGLPRVLAPPGHDDAVDPALEQGLEIVLLADAVIAAVAQEDRDAARAERVLGALHDRDAEPAETVGRDQPDGETAPGQQAAGQGIGLVTELVGGLADPLHRGGADATTAIERFRCCARGHARETGHVRDRHRPSADGTRGRLPRLTGPTRSGYRSESPSKSYAIYVSVSRPDIGPPEPGARPVKSIDPSRSRFTRHMSLSLDPPSRPVLASAQYENLCVNADDHAPGTTHWGGSRRWAC